MSDCTKGCDVSCNSDCGCGSTHHHCGCPCHATPDGLDEQHQHAERMATKWLARYQDLSAEVGRVPGTCEKPDERVQLRAVIEAMRPIVEAALEWKKAADDPTAEVWKYTERLDAAIDAYRNRTPPTASIHERDIEWHTWPLRSPGGQHVGTSAGVLAIHRPTGIAAVVMERSMLRSKDAAFALLKQLIGQRP